MARRGFDRRNPPEPSLTGVDPAQHVQRIVEAAERTAMQIREEAEAEAQRYLEEYKRRVDKLVSERVQLTDTLAEQTGRIKEQYDRFLAALDGALQKVGEIAGNGQSELDPHESARRYAAESEAPPLGPDPLAPPERSASPAGSRDPEPEYDEPAPSRLPRWRPKARAQAEAAETSVPAEPADREHRGAPPETTRGGYRPRPAAKGERLLAMQMLAAGESRAEIERRLQDEFGMPDPATLIDELLGE